jgi:hypothetical protein
MKVTLLLPLCAFAAGKDASQCLLTPISEPSFQCTHAVVPPTLREAAIFE